MRMTNRDGGSGGRGGKTRFAAGGVLIRDRYRRLTKSFGGVDGEGRRGTGGEMMRERER